MIKKGFGLFGCKAAQKWVSRYELAITKMMIEDPTFCERWSSVPACEFFRLQPLLADVVDVARELHSNGVKVDYEMLHNSFAVVDKVGDYQDIITAVQGVDMTPQQLRWCVEDMPYWTTFIGVVKLRNHIKNFLEDGIHREDAVERLISLSKEISDYE